MFIFLFAALADARRKRGRKNYKPKNYFNNYHSSKQPDEFYSYSSDDSAGAIGCVIGLIGTLFYYMFSCCGCCRKSKDSKKKYNKAFTDVEQYNKLIDSLIQLVKEYNHELNRTRKEYYKAKLCFRHPKRIPNHINHHMVITNYIHTTMPVPDYLYNERVNNYSHIVRHYKQLHEIRKHNLSL